MVHVCPAFGVFCPVYMCVLVCTFVEEVSADSLAATTPFVAPRSKIGKLLMQIRLIRGAKRSAEKFGFCGGLEPLKFYDPPPCPLYGKSANSTPLSSWVQWTRSPWKPFNLCLFFAFIRIYRKMIFYLNGSKILFPNN